MVKMVYGIPVIVTPEDGTFHPRMDDIKEAVSSYTKAIILNSPNNPSGLVFSDTFMAEIIEFCETKGIYLILDDIYQKLVFDGVCSPVAYCYSNNDIESSKLIVVNGVSKLYGMTGFRIGWVVGPRKLIEAMAKIQSQVTSNASVISQAAAEGALTGVQSVVENLRLTIQNNRDIIMQELQSFNGVRTARPQGTFYCLPDFKAYSQNSVELAQFLLEKALVVTVPGSSFGMEGHLRLSYAGGVKDITEGIQRLKWALDPQSPNEIYIGDRRLIRDWL
jgi:aspartate aminotransferase